MSTAVQSPSAEHAGNPTPEPEHRRKRAAEERIGELIRKYRELEEKLEAAHMEIKALTDRLAITEPEEQAIWRQLESLRRSVPALDEALRILGDIPEPFKREISRMPNPAGFLVFLSGATDFLEYLRDLRADAAVRRIRRAGYDVHAKLPQIAGGK